MVSSEEDKAARGRAGEGYCTIGVVGIAGIGEGERLWSFFLFMTSCVCIFSGFFCPPGGALSKRGTRMTDADNVALCRERALASFKALLVSAGNRCHVVRLA